MLFTARTLDEAAAAITAQPDPDAHEVYASGDGFSRDLNTDEQARLKMMRARARA